MRHFHLLLDSCPDSAWCQLTATFVYLRPFIVKSTKSLARIWQEKMSCSHAVVQSCGRKAISFIGLHDNQTAGPQDKKAARAAF